VTALTTVVVRVSLAPGDAEGEGDREDDAATAPLGLPAPETAATSRAAAPRTTQSAGTTVLQ
jgi:hypothetical protein